MKFRITLLYSLFELNKELVFETITSLIEFGRGTSFRTFEE
ncbi:unnamed protein product [marine sediment metagenome]|uniref:Uncharacterized protein n=1 Tax=marine sediment metagenome TaxID=412755 RepID=X1VTN4_9ZZZZ